MSETVALGDAASLRGRWLEQVLRWLVEIPAAIAVVAEVIILFAGIVARGIFHRPIIWSDELASILFLWLAMLGSAIAVQRSAHMRLTFFTSYLSPRAEAFSSTLAAGAVALFLAIILHPALDYVEDQAFVETPALGWSGMVRAAAIPVGCIIALASICLTLVKRSAKDLLAIALLFAAIAGALYLAGPSLKPLGNWNLLIFFVGLLGCAVMAGVPIAFSFCLATVAFLLTTTRTPLLVVVGRIDEGMSSLILLAVPLFVLLGQLVEQTGMARVMVAFLASVLGHVRGGLSYVMLGAMLLVSGISGSKTADMAAIAPVLFPEMRKRGMKDGELVSLLAASGAMSETIPPSIVLIAIASVTGVSIAALFTAGILPGIVLAIVLAFVARYRAGARENAAVKVARAPMSVMAKTFWAALPALALPFLIRSAVVEGYATATEVSTIGIAYCLVLGLIIYRGSLSWKNVLPMLVQTASLSGSILFIVGAASAMAWALAQSGFSHELAARMAGVPGGAWGFLLISVVAFIVLGSVLEGIPAIVLFGPLLFPVAATFGINEVHYAMVVILAMGLGLFAPPFGLCYYAACIIGGVPPDAGMRRIWIYLAWLFVGLLLITFVPWISLAFL
ncbi:TRAP transporter large permease subunit [Bradyrhizobium sp. ISRA443]|uniref:TRAP transporter large permease n=1 Tax=unclassified Bradyrhizobium TaxID=2631580 RepID=UPI00247935B1|nr:MULTISPECIES: TRAP transporter large permease subunit [unclassified Bradyrhizobium]WGR96162.1 TRAP transporter large permease subunit [Bradyrhizobium sp. ISRA435]WGS02723.1 TRAP transporter large permease subunit [Bradyrhizobium sp. ISRA436]WGS09611.1 TRAP transporter large permease subunit [Bradyrhizobium sp. ISRA437]WGS16494.1 TRAP transporter large permease subunit [Bradyrhizobium sp. ISRA443]